MAATMWLMVYPVGASLGSNGTLLCKTLDTAHLPRPDDKIHVLFASEGENSEWYAPTSVEKVYWNADGETHLELVSYQLANESDPPGSSVSRYRSVWWEERDGDLVEQLLASGWTTEH